MFRVFRAVAPVPARVSTRSILLRGTPALFSAAASNGSAAGATSVSREARDNITRNLSALKEECKGQGLDLADMADASRAAARALQDALRKADVSDKQLTGKAATLSASLKAYNMRLSNLQNEARSIQAETEAILRLLWGTEAPQTGAAAAGRSAGVHAAPKDDFDVEPPLISKILEGEADEAASSTSARPSPPPQEAAKPKKAETPVERVEGERVESTSFSSARKSGNTASEESDASKSEGEESISASEIEVETIEVEVDGETVTADSTTSNSSSKATSAAAEEGSSSAKSRADTMSITEITKDLYERGVNFSDCLDARTLRQRYKDVLDGKVHPGTTAAGTTSSSSSSTRSAPQSPNAQQPRMPQPAQRDSEKNSYQGYSQNSTTNETGISSDPYPNAHRKMVDPMKYVWEIKQELSVEKGVDPMNVDLWSGKCKLEDHKRLYDYPSIQSYPIEVRQKGDIPH